jgi:hypothetical protein
VSTATTVASPSPLTTWSRYALIAFAWLFAVGGVVQVFLAGLAVFEGDPFGFDYWEDHVDFGRMIGLLTYLLPVLALIGRVGVRLVVHALVVAILFVVQSILPNVDETWVAALHPVNGFLLIGAAGSLGGATLGLIRSQARPNSEPSPRRPGPE